MIKFTYRGHEFKMTSFLRKSMLKSGHDDMDIPAICGIDKDLYMDWLDDNEIRIVVSTKGERNEKTESDS